MTSSRHVARRGRQTPRVSQYPAHSYSAAEDAIELADLAGLQLDDWQKYVLTHGLGRTLDGYDEGGWTATRVGCWVPRQNGKGGIIEALELLWLFVSGEQLILHSAHEYKTAQEAFIRIRDLIQGCPSLDPLVNRYWQGSGEQGIELTRRAGGARLRFVARSRSSGRGFSGDKNILDEGQYLNEAMMAALMPTLSARPDPQMWIFGTPPEDSDAWAYGLRDEGEAGAARLAWFDWGADLNPLDAKQRSRWTDRELWYQTNPALGIRITEATVEDESGPAGLGDRFPMERLGAWLPRAVGGSILDAATWRDMRVKGAKRLGDVALSLDVAPLLDHASIGMYAPEGQAPNEDGDMVLTGKEHVQVVAYREGVDWAASALAEFVAVLDPICVVVHAKNGAHAMLDRLAEVGLTVPEDPEEPRRGQVLVIDDTMAADAVGQWLRTFKAGGFQHIGDAPLDAAVENVQARPIGDGGQIGWARRKSEVDIGPLCSVTWPRYGFHAWKDLVADDYDVLNSVW